ncbi:MAG: hypothetical protein H6712_22315 [Myxococcales bacterium]|nr:hypothetical protein [Myxococcales bacterium]MCB9716610.1 hypothetical protein [Myxococcales bacterium]
MLGLLVPLTFQGVACKLSPEKLTELQEHAEQEERSCSSGCYDYCRVARCMFPDDADGRACEAFCQKGCTDGIYPSADLMFCQESVVYDPTCEQTLACCAEADLNDLCPPAPAADAEPGADAYEDVYEDVSKEDAGAGAADDGGDGQ